MPSSYSLGEARCKAETSKGNPDEGAILCEVDSMDEPLWVPKSQVHGDSEVYREGTSGDLVVMEWWARKKGFAD